MAPLKPVKKKPADQRVRPILDFAVAIAQTLKDRLPCTTNTLSELEAFVKQPFPSPSAVALARKSVEYDAQGSTLWNAATKILRDHNENDGSVHKVDSSRFGMLLRAFAYLLLDVTHNASPHRTQDNKQTIRISKIALKASRCSLDNNDLELASKLLESCSKYISAWDDATLVIRMAASEHSDEDGEVRSLHSDYYLLRMVHASRSGRLDLAEHFFHKANINSSAEHSNISETAAQLCYEIGRSQQLQQRIESARSWLERGYLLLSNGDDTTSFLENEDLRLAIAASFVENLTSTCDDDDAKRAWDLLKSLEQDHGLGNRMAVLAMQLNVLMRTDDVEISAVSAVVSKMVRCSVLTDQSYRTIMHSICKAKRTSLDTALSALEQLVDTRLLPDLDAVMENDQMKAWLEKAIVTYTSFCTTTTDVRNPNTAERMSALFDQVFQQTGDSLSARATHAMQALIWKASNDVTGDTVVEPWLDLLQHSLFRSVGASNKARISRKVMLNAIAKDELATARAAFYALPASSQNEGMTRYLAFKFALRSNDVSMAGECLESLVKHADKEPRYLYACILEAQQAGHRTMAVAAFQALIEQPPNNVQLPALFRCTARLLTEELESSSRDTIEVTRELVNIFATASTNTKALRQSTEQQWRNEIQWWSKNAFNLVLQHYHVMSPEQLVRLSRSCNKFLECYPDDSGLMHCDDVIQRKQICHFISASALTVLARTMNDRQEQLQHYLEVQREAKAFLTIWEEPRHQTADAELCRARALELLRFNVESVFKLEQWNNLDEALAACLNFSGNVRWETLADLLMIIYSQTSNLAIDSSATTKIPELLQKIINETWTKDKDILKLARWLRFTFSVGLSDANSNVSIKLVEQAAALAWRGTEGRNDPYPEDELQWLATTAFNRAVDLLAAEERSAAEQWLEASLELARYAADNGSLHAQLTRTREEAERRMKRH